MQAHHIVSCGDEEFGVQRRSSVFCHVNLQGQPTAKEVSELRGHDINFSNEKPHASARRNWTEDDVYSTLDALRSTANGLGDAAK